ELRNPLGVIESSLYILQGRVGGDERAVKHVKRIGEQLGIANDIISALLDMIRDRPLERERLRIADVLDGVIDAVKRPPGVALTVEGVAELPELRADGGRSRPVLLNLIDNAVPACGAGGDVHVRRRAARGAGTLP